MVPLPQLRAPSAGAQPIHHRPALVGFGVLVCLVVVGGATLATGVPSRAANRAGSTASAAAVAAAAAAALAVPTASPTSTPTASPASAATPTDTATPLTTAAPGTKPWLAWKPTGSGNVTVVNMPAPWTGGTTADVSIYTPPGYNPFGSLLYPVLYEAPTGLALWSSSGAGVAQLDALIDSGAMPAAIVVFIDESDPPLSPSECVDSYNGQQWFESYISNTVVNYVDENYRTIADPRARAIMGMSEGGFCSAMLALRHPEVYSVSISFSGYFWAGTPSDASTRPYGNQADLDAHSPALLAPQIPVSLRSKMYFIVVADHGQEFFGPQALDFDKVLAANGYRYLAVNSPDGHGWDEVQLETPNALAVWGAEMVISGIW